jgi:hypothetical protein
MPADPKAPPRIIDPAALKAARMTGEPCAACGGPPANVHHVIQKSAPYFGDDVIGNLLLLCGSGTSGCHGAHHGSPYLVDVPDSMFRERPLVERRDAEWVNRRIGITIQARRPDIIAYVLGKLGDHQGRFVLEKIYYLRLEN